MTDWYQRMFGRPNPGRRAPTPASRYLDDPASEPEANAPQRGIFIEPRGLPNTEAPVPPRWARTDRDRTANVPFSVASEQERNPAPFGDDFVTWLEWTREPMPEFLRREPEVGPAIEQETNPGRTPTYANNVPLGIEGGTRHIPTRLEMGADDHAPTVEHTFEPLSPAWDEERQAGIRPDFDPDRAWVAARQRSRERWRAGQPSAVDMFFAAVFGNRGVMGSENRIRRETQEMRDEIRNDRR